MELNYFKDILFDLINEWDEDILDVTVNDKENLIRVVMGDGSVFHLHCEKGPIPFRSSAECEKPADIE